MLGAYTTAQVMYAAIACEKVYGPWLDGLRGKCGNHSVGELKVSLPPKNLKNAKTPEHLQY